MRAAARRTELAAHASHPVFRLETQDPTVSAAKRKEEPHTYDERTGHRVPKSDYDRQHAHRAQAAVHTHTHTRLQSVSRQVCSQSSFVEGSRGRSGKASFF